MPRDRVAPARLGRAPVRERPFQEPVESLDKLMLSYHTPLSRYLLLPLLCLALLAGRPFHESPAAGAQAAAGPPAITPARERAYRANNVGVAALEQFNYQDAERSFRDALTIAPDLSLARLNLAIALLYAGRPGDAVVEAREASGSLAELPQAHYVLGLAARADDKPADAVAAFERVLRLDPGDAATKVQLGQIHLQGRRYDEAVRLFGEALAAEPYNVTAAYNVALASTRAGKADEGRAAMQRFETLRDSPYGVTYAQTYLSQGRYAEAVASSGAEPDLVDPAVPDVTFSTAPLAAPSPAPAASAAGTDGALTLFDADGDGDLDLLDVGPGRLRFLRNDRGAFSDETTAAGLAPPSSGTLTGAVAGDADNDGRPDVFLFGPSGSRLFHQKADGTFEDRTAQAGLPAPPAAAATAAFADLDHDGDLDLVVAGSTVQLLQNNGSGVFTDITAAAGAGGEVAARAVAPADYDNRRDIDLLVLGRERLFVYRNMRNGTFRESAADAGLAAAIQGSDLRALAVGDVNKDGYPDIFVGGGDGAGVLALSDGQTRFKATAAPPATAGARAAQFLDYDNDGVLDLLALTPRGPRLLRNGGAAGWTDVTERAQLTAAAPDGPDGAAHAMALGDLDGDGDTDAVLRHPAGALRLLKNGGAKGHASLRARLAARVSNRGGIGAKVEMRAGSLRQTLEVSSATPAVAPADLVFGLGAREAADVVRVLWPSGILQAETTLPAGAGGGAAPVMPVVIEELDRKPSSCPYLFTWNGSSFEFVSDFMGGGEMGAWLAPAVWNDPDPDEYVRIRADQLQPRAGRYELRMTNELEEALFFDRVQLVAVDHRSDVEVYPNEGLRSLPRPPFALTAVRGARPPKQAHDGHGHDVLASLAALDRRYPDDFALSPIRGYAEPHELVLDIGSGVERPVLLLTGWTDYAFSNDNVAASQAGAAMSPPSLQVRNRAGEWQTVAAEIGFPVGRPQTVVVDLAGKFLSASREVRILTSMRIYWDQIQVASAAAAASPAVTRLDPVSATLRWRGLSAETTPDGREPFGYDYARVSTTMPWKTMIGRYTREGDVRPLLAAADDMFVIAKPGDEVALSFAALAAPAAGWQRTFLLYAYGYSKEMNPRSAIPDTVGPLPFRGMSGYPYGPDEHYPRSPRHREYQEMYNTRPVIRAVPSIDAAVSGGPSPASASARDGGGR